MCSQAENRWFCPLQGPAFPYLTFRIGPGSEILFVQESVGRPFLQQIPAESEAKANLAEKGRGALPTGRSRTAQDVIMLLRKAHDLKRMNCLFLEFFLYCFQTAVDWVTETTDKEGLLSLKL